MYQLQQELLFITESLCQEYFQESTIIVVFCLWCSPQSISLITCCSVLVILLTPTIDVYVVESFFYVEFKRDGEFGVVVDG